MFEKAFDTIADILAEAVPPGRSLSHAPASRDGFPRFEILHGVIPGRGRKAENPESQ